MKGLDQMSVVIINQMFFSLFDTKMEIIILKGGSFKISIRSESFQSEQQWAKGRH